MSDAAKCCAGCGAPLPEHGQGGSASAEPVAFGSVADVSAEHLALRIAASKERLMEYIALRGPVVLVARESAYLAHLTSAMNGRLTDPSITSEVLALSHPRVDVSESTPPAPRECGLSDGSVVTWDASERILVRKGGHRVTLTRIASAWIELLDIGHTGADFDALKRFAAEVG